MDVATKKYVNKYPYKVRKYGPITERRDYSVTKITWNVPDFLVTSKESFEWFKKNWYWRIFKRTLPNYSDKQKSFIRIYSKFCRFGNSF